MQTRRYEKTGLETVKSSENLTENEINSDMQVRNLGMSEKP